MPYIRFVVAPEWFMKLPNTYVLTSKAVLELYGYKLHNDGSSQISHMISRGNVPKPDNIVIRPKRNKIGWSVGYLKNYLKLPTELIEVKKEEK